MTQYIKFAATVYLILAVLILVTGITGCDKLHMERVAEVKTTQITWINDYTSGSWGKAGGSSATTNTVTFGAATDSQISQSISSPGGVSTVAALVSVASGTKTFRLKYYNGVTDAYSSDFTATTTPTICTLAITGASGGNIGLTNSTAGGVGTVVVDGIGLFKGTWTAAQILAEGGIPTTTATAASNPSAGKYWWSFDGSNDSLLSGNLGITNACTIVIAGRVNSLVPAYQTLLEENTNGVSIYMNSAGDFKLGKTGVGLIIEKTAVIVAGVPFVLTCRLSGGTAVLRKNGVQVATYATAITFSAITGARIGDSFTPGDPTGGAIGWVVPLPTALSDADCLTVERLVSSQFPNGPVF